MARERAVSITPPQTPIEDREVLDLLTSLVQKSLVVYEEDEQGRGRYRLLETVRQYSRDRLREAGEGEAVRDRHLSVFLALADEAEPELWRDAVWLERLESEHDNLRGALDWCTGRSKQIELRLAGALWWFWSIRGHWSEARQRLETALAGGASVEPTVRCEALCAAGYIMAGLGDTERAAALGEESLSLCRQAGDKAGVAWSLTVLAEIALHQAQYTRAAALADESLALFREGGDHRGAALALHMLALALGCGGARPGEPSARPEVLEEECLAICRQEGYRWLAGVSLSHLGYLAQGTGRDQRARVVLEESLAIDRELGNRANSAFALRGLGHLARAVGDDGRAVALYEEALALLRECGDKPGSVGVLCEIGRVALARGEYERASAVLDEALTVSTEAGSDSAMQAALLDMARLAYAQGALETARALLERVRALPQGMYGRSEQGHLLLEWGDHAAARSCYEEELALLRSGEHTGPIPWAHLQVGHAAWLQGEHGVMQSRAVEALRLLQARGNQPGILAALESLAVAALGQGRKERAARLMGAVAARRDDVGYLAAGWWRPFRRRIRDAVRAASLEQEFAAAWAQGRAMSLPQAIEYALQPEGTAPGE